MNQSKRTALVVDDEKTIAYVLLSHLKRLGYEPMAASNGEEAISASAGQRFDLVLLDVSMPGMSGLEVLKKLRRDNAEVCVVMLSAVVDTAVVAQAMKLGADDYITKPCSLDYLRNRIEKAHEKREQAFRASGTSPNSHDEAQKQGDSFGEVTRDLLEQQVALFKEATSLPQKGDKQASRHGPWIGNP